VLKLISLSGKKSKNLKGLNLSDLGVKTYLLERTCPVFSGKHFSVLESKIRKSIKLSAVVVKLISHESTCPAFWVKI
jgi:hypothetical protein